MSLTDVFEVFYNCTVEIGTIAVSSEYVDDDGEFSAEGSYKADFQPYNGGLAQREYGYDGEVTACIYTEPSNGVISTGKIAVIDGVRYDVIYAEAWDMGDTALLKRRRD